MLHQPRFNCCRAGLKGLVEVVFGLGFRVYGLRVCGFKFGFGLGFRVEGLGFRFGSGCSLPRSKAG